MTRESKPQPVRPERIVSGGQTGVDRAALDVAIELGISHGGWCPAGRLAEDGPIPRRYHLTETDSPEYPVRTERNVLESDATLILCRGAGKGARNLLCEAPFGPFRQKVPGTFSGTELTRRLAERHGRPCLVVDLDAPPDDATVRQWIAQHGPGTLNVAGPRESQSPGIGGAAAELLRQWLVGGAGG